jgi:hypothetical protein
VKPRSPAARLRQFLAKYDPEIATRARAILAKMRARLPGALELVYDNYNALVIGFGPTGRASGAIFSVVLYPKWVTLFFLQGAKLPDPRKLLKGSGNVVRHIVLQAASDLDEPPLEALIACALERARVPLTAKGGRRMVIKSVSAKQRPRRPK